MGHGAPSFPYDDEEEALFGETCHANFMKKMMMMLCRAFPSGNLTSFLPSIFSQVIYISFSDLTEVAFHIVAGEVFVIRASLPGKDRAC